MLVAFAEAGLDLSHGSGAVLAVTFAIGNTVEPLTSALIVGAICGPEFSLERVRDTLALAFAGCLSPIVSATIASTAASVEGLTDFWTWWTAWWAGDVVGGFAVAAALVVWRTQAHRPKLRPRTVAFLWVSGVIGTAASLVGGDRIPIAFLTAPVLVLIAVRAGRAGVTGAALGLALLGEYTAWRHIGPLAGSYSRVATIGLTQLFVGVSLFTMLVLNAASSQALTIELQAEERESIGFVARDVAHDINHLLALILANCELLSTQLDASTPHWEPLERIVQGAQRTSKIVRQLQVVSSPFAGARRSDLNDVIRAMEPLLRSAAGPENTLSISLSPIRCVVLIGISDIEQVLLNLILNAREATHGTISVSTHILPPKLDHHAEAVLAVTDDGSGMDQHLVMHAFDAWFSNTNDRSHGVGLPRVHGIVERHGGTVDIKSRVGVGTEVRVKWPLDPLDVEDTSSGAEERTMPIVIGPDLAPTILVTAFDPKIQTHLLETLSGTGYRIAFVEGAAETLTMSRSLDRVDAVIMQAALTGLNGLAVANRLVVERPGLPIMLLGDLSSLPGRSLPDAVGWMPVPPVAEALLRWIKVVAPLS